MGCGTFEDLVTHLCYGVAHWQLHTNSVQMCVSPIEVSIPEMVGVDSVCRILPVVHLQGSRPFQATHNAKMPSWRNCAIVLPLCVSIFVGQCVLQIPANLGTIRLRSQSVLSPLPLVGRPFIIGHLRMGRGNTPCVSWQLVGGLA